MIPYVTVKKDKVKAPISYSEIIFKQKFMKLLCFWGVRWPYFFSTNFKIWAELISVKTEMEKIKSQPIFKMLI